MDTTHIDILHPDDGYQFVGRMVAIRAADGRGVLVLSERDNPESFDFDLERLIDILAVPVVHHVCMADGTRVLDSGHAEAPDGARANGSDREVDR